MPTESAQHARGLIDTNIVILREWIDPQQLPLEVAISAVTLAELSAGPHLVSGRGADARLERARRTAILQRTENEFEPLPFDSATARVYGELAGAIAARGRTPRRRLADLQIAATAVANRLPLFTCNPGDFAGLGDFLTVVRVTRPRSTH